MAAQGAAPGAAAGAALGPAEYSAGPSVAMNQFFSPAFFTFSPQNALFRHNRFSTLFFSMKVEESRKSVFLIFF
jgi:hypothetical protein